MRISDWSSDVCSSDLPSLAGRSRTWPNEARTVWPGPRYFSMVFAFAGLSTTTTFIRCCFQTINFTKHGDGETGAAYGTWAMPGSLGSEERRVGEECVSRCRSRGVRYQKEKKDRLNYKMS